MPVPVSVNVWKVGATPTLLPQGTLATEEALREMIVADPKLLDERWMLIGREVDTQICGRIDLLALDPDGHVILIELKRDKTPREVVAQSLDYASWVSDLKPDKIAAIYTEFSKGRSIADDWKSRFEGDYAPEEVNTAHEIVIVAAKLDASSERIVKYLRDRGISINVLSFQVFSHGGDLLLTRAWLTDPEEDVAAVAAATPKGEWNGEFYCNYGASETRSWDEAMKYGFVSAGGGKWYSSTMKLVQPGDRIWVKVPGKGFVGVAKITGPAEAATEFHVEKDGKQVLALDVLTGGHYHREFLRDLDMCEWFVPVRWLQTVPLDQAVSQSGFYGIQHSMCRPTSAKWRATVEQLKGRFPKYND